MASRRPLLPHVTGAPKAELSLVSIANRTGRIFCARFFARLRRLFARRFAWRLGFVILALLSAFALAWQTCSSCVLFPALYLALHGPRAPPTGAWMDTRERQLVEDTIGTLRAEAEVSRRPTRMLEYGSGASTFHFSHLVDEYLSIEHDFAYCDGLFRMASEANPPVAEDDLEIYRVSRDASGGLVSTRWDPSRLPVPSTPRIRIFCVSSTAGMVRPEASSWWMGWYCCFTRCPTPAAVFEDYMRLPEWIQDLMGPEARVPPGRAKRVFGGPDSRELVAASGGVMSSSRLFPSPSSSAPSSHFDIVLVDGRARPQCAWFIWPLLRSGSGRVIIHDWTRRRAYHEALQIYTIEAEAALKDSTQPGGGGLVVLAKKHDSDGALKNTPDWWLGAE